MLIDRGRIRACGHDQGFPIALDLRMHIGGKTPRYLVDLLFGEDTEIGTYDPDAWHEELKAYIDAH